MTEDVLVRMGIDARPVSAALRGVRKSFAELKSDLGRMNPFSILQTGLGALGIAASGAALAAFGKSAIDFAGQITDMAEATGATGTTIQSFGMQVAQSGGSVEDAQKALGKIADKLKETGDRTKTTDQALAELADKVKDAKNPVDQLAIASEALGDKLALKVVNSLREGSKGLEDFKKAASASILSEAELARLDDIGDRFTTMGAKLKAWMGRGISIASSAFMGDSGTAQMIKEINALMAGGGKTPGGIRADPKKVAEAAEKLARAERDLDFNRRTERGKAVILQKELLTLQEKALKADEGSVEKLEAKTKALEKQKELEDQIEKVNKLDADFAKKKLDDKEKLLLQLQKERGIVQEISAAERDRAVGRGRLETRLGDQTKFSLQDLASINPDRYTTPAMRRDIWNARRVQWMEGRARSLAAHGYEDQAQKVLGEADKVRSGIKSLTSDERFPYEEMLNSERKQAEALEKLYEKASNEGMKVEVVGVAP